MKNKKDDRIEIDKRTLRNFSEFCYYSITSNFKLRFSHGEKRRASWLGWFPITPYMYKKIKKQLKNDRSQERKRH